MAVKRKTTGAHKPTCAIGTSRRPATTIIEVVMAIVILSIALPPLIGSFVDASNQSILPANSALASFLATERMEEIIARRYRANDGYAAITTTNYPNETPVSGFPRFNRSVSVTFTDSGLNTVGSDQGYKKVRVTVTWNSGANEIVIERVFASFQA
jgi:hypothetical protein